MRKWLLALAGLLLTAQIASGAFGIFQTAASVPAVCSAGVLDTFAASPGSWTAAYGLRKLRAAYGGSAVQLTRTSDSTTQDVGFSGCNPGTDAGFCTTATLAVGAASSRVAFPSGSVIYAYNTGPSIIFWAAGNSSVTATTAGTALNFRQGADPITVGANTHIAALIGTGFGVDGGTGSATLFLTNCAVTKFYEQSGSGVGDAAQITAGAANRMGYVPSAQGSLPLVFGCLTNCGMKVADSATYKTTTVNAFSVMSFGEDITTSNFFYNSIGYPTTTGSTAAAMRWGSANTSLPDYLFNNINGSDACGACEGFGGVWRGQNLTQYDYSTGGILRWNGGTQFESVTGASITYPNAVGLYIMGDAAGHGTPGTWAESLVASGTQTARDSISANQVSYWGITTGTSATTARTNPLGDGFNWNQTNLGGFAPNPPGTGATTVNGSAYNSEAAWNDYSQWSCTNCISTGGRLGDMYRFQVTGVSDNWDGTNRSELDGAGGAAQFNNGTTYWIAYAVYVEAGTAYTSSWNINGQMHAAGTATVCCVFNTMSNDNISATDTWFVYTYNTNTGSSTSVTTGVPFTRGRWYHFVYQVLVSTSGTGDTFNVWLDTVTPGTMVQIANHTSATLFGGNTLSTLSYWKYGIYRATGAVLPTFGIRYGNMQVCSAGAGCTSKYGVSDLSALTTTPLADPSH